MIKIQLPTVCKKIKCLCVTCKYSSFAEMPPENYFSVKDSGQRFCWYSSRSRTLRRFSDKFFVRGTSQIIILFIKLKNRVPGVWNRFVCKIKYFETADSPDLTALWNVWFLFHPFLRSFVTLQPIIFYKYLVLFNTLTSKPPLTSPQVLFYLYCQKSIFLLIFSVHSWLSCDFEKFKVISDHLAMFIWAEKL